MDREVYIVTSIDEVFIGTVVGLLDDSRQDKLELAIRDILDDLVFGNQSKDYAVLTIELR